MEDPHGKVLDERKDTAVGHVGFTTKVAGEYKACFSAPDLASAQARIRMRCRLCLESP